MKVHRHELKWYEESYFWGIFKGLKQTLRRSKTGVRRESKAFQIYSRQSFVDTLTLFLHGICCDIDVETGPRQLASRHMRKRLELLRKFYPPPKGYAVFPEDLKG